jgi:MSHA biogenesis protein MshI
VKRDARVRAALVPTDRDTGLAVVQRRKGERPLLTHCGVHPAIEIKPEHLLTAMIPSRALNHTAVSGLLSGSDYQLVQVEAPDVPPAELRSAVRWKLRDAVNFPLDDAVIDVFSLPDPPRSDSRMIVAVAARGAAVQRVVALLASRARRFDVVDIPELSLRNIATLLPQDERGVALVAVGEGFAHLLVTRRGLLYLARRIDLSHRHEIEFDAYSGNNADAATLALEIQRSLDYYESHFDLPPINDLVIAPADNRVREVSTALQAQIGLQVETLDIERLVQLADGLEIDASWLGLLALGGALRELGGD